MNNSNIQNPFSFVEWDQEKLFDEKPRVNKSRDTVLLTSFYSKTFIELVSVLEMLVRV
jgi:hypothetical protein